MHNMLAKGATHQDVLKGAAKKQSGGKKQNTFLPPLGHTKSFAHGNVQLDGGGDEMDITLRQIEMTADQFLSD